MAPRFDHKKIEREAQEKWETLKLYQANLDDTDKDPYYLLFEFPYPSGDLHIGHWYAYAVTDIYARQLRAQGKNVLFPIGFDAFGLPAENAAIKQGADPKEWTYQNMERMRSQVKLIGTSVDWSKEIVTCDPEYYKWTQWLFLQLHEKGLAYRAEAPVKWCPKDKTVLANEQVIDGKCERCDSEVEEKKLTQWFMKITQYAERLLKDLDALNWREEIKEAQRAWIGKSEGAKLWFEIKDSSEKVEVFTTRPDTVFGATYVVLAPEHKLVEIFLVNAQNKKEIENYVKATKKRTERERSENKEKTGVCVEGVFAINPATKEEIPVYVADYVLGSYGTGAVMAVPAHDERDFAFAHKYDLPIRQVVVPCQIDQKNPPQEGFEEIKRDTVIVHLRDTVTGKYALLDWHESLEGITTAIMGGIEADQTPEEAALAEIAEEAGLSARIIKQARSITAAKYCASHKKQNRSAHAYGFLAEVDGLKDQKALDAYETKTHTLVWVDESEVLSRLTPPHQKLVWQLLQEDQALLDDGYLINSGSFDGCDNREAMWDIVKSVGGERTTNYRIRDWLISRQRYWGCPIPVVYDPQGAPHPVPAEHLPWTLPTDVDFKPSDKAPLASSKELHARVEKIFGKGWTPEYDTLDVFVDSSWYYLRYLAPNNAEAFTDMNLAKKWMPVKRYSGGSEHTTVHVLYARFLNKALFDLGLSPASEPFAERYNRGLILAEDGRKMSKRWANVVNPDEQVSKYGADAVRMYLAFIGPYNEAGHYPWNERGVESMYKLLDRVYALKDKTGARETTLELQKALALATKKMKDDSDKFKFNTALSFFMVLTKAFEGAKEFTKNEYHSYLILLAPFAPHLAEHLWSETGGEGSVHSASLPPIDEALLVENEVTVAIQINGKRRAEVIVPASASKEEVIALAQQVAGLEETLSKSYKNIVYVPARIINFVA